MSGIRRSPRFTVIGAVTLRVRAVPDQFLWPESGTTHRQCIVFTQRKHAPEIVLADVPSMEGENGRIGQLAAVE